MDNAEVGERIGELPPRTFRKLVATERERVREHLLRLDPADRRLRFMAALDNEAVGAYAATISQLRGVTVGCFIDGALRGVAELRLPMARRGALAEAAVTVEGPWQGKGIGTELMRRIVAIARNRCVTRLRLECLSENVTMRHIAQHLGGQLRFVDGAVEADIRQPWPDFWSLLGEAVADSQTLLLPWSPPSSGRAMARRAGAH